MNPDSGISDSSSAAADSNTEICGESFDHDEDIVFEDNGTRQWICRRCGAEGWEDFDE